MDRINAFTAAELESRRQEPARLLDIRNRDHAQLLRDARTFVSVGCVVEVEYFLRGLVASHRVTATVSRPRTLSARSPVGRELMGHVAGDVVAVGLPGGRVERVRVLSAGPPEG